MSDDVVSLEIAGKRFDKWSQYAFNSSFLTPTDGFSFEVGGDAITTQLLDVLVPGAPVTLRIGDLVQGTGYIDVIDPHTDRSGGSTIQIHGRDKLSVICDSQIDPRQTYPDNQTLDKFLHTALKPYGFTEFVIDNEKNTNVSAGKLIKRRRKPKKLNAYKMKQNKPHNNEAVFSFVSRVIQRLGLWMWLSVDGATIIVSTPDFDQPPRYKITNRRSDPSKNNIMSGGIVRDFTDQPSFITVRGNVPGSTYEHTVTGVTIGNALDPIWSSVGKDIQQQLLGNDFVPETVKSLKAVHEAPIIDVITTQASEKETVTVPASPITIKNQFASTVARPIYLRDDISQTLEELQRYAKREMSMRQRKAVVGKYEIIGHRLNGQPIQVDTVIDVEDELSNWNHPMWVASRTFKQSRGGGTTTSIEVLPLNVLSF